MKKPTAFWFGLSMFFLGVSLGFLISPAKAGIGSNNGNNFYLGHTPEKHDAKPEKPAPAAPKSV